MGENWNSFLREIIRGIIQFTSREFKLQIDDIFIGIEHRRNSRFILCFAMVYLELCNLNLILYRVNLDLG